MTLWKRLELNYESKPLFGDEPSRLAELATFLEDIERARAAIIRAKETGDIDLLNILREYAVLNYARPFVADTRKLLPRKRVLETLTESQRKLHDSLVRERNKFIAHSDNVQEQSIVAIRLNNPRAGLPTGYAGIGSMNLRTVAISPELEEFLDLIEALRSTIGTLMDAGLAALDEHYRALPLDELYAMPPMHFAPLTQDRGVRRTEFSGGIPFFGGASVMWWRPWKGERQRFPDIPYAVADDDRSDERGVTHQFRQD